MSRGTIVQLAPGEARNFTVGRCLTSPNWLTRLQWFAAQVFWWRRRRFVVVAVDQDRGCIELADLLWSWWEFRWVLASDVCTRRGHRVFPGSDICTRCGARTARLP